MVDNLNKKLEIIKRDIVININRRIDIYNNYN